MAEREVADEIIDPRRSSGSLRTRFRQARRVQDAIERLLYREGLTLSGEKSSVKRTETVLEERRQVSGLLEERNKRPLGWESLQWLKTSIPIPSHYLTHPR